MKASGHTYVYLHTPDQRYPGRRRRHDHLAGRPRARVAHGSKGLAHGSRTGSRTHRERVVYGRAGVARAPPHTPIPPHPVREGVQGSLGAHPDPFSRLPQSSRHSMKRHAVLTALRACARGAPRPPPGPAATLPDVSTSCCRASAWLLCMPIGEIGGKLIRHLFLFPQRFQAHRKEDSAYQRFSLQPVRPSRPIPLRARLSGGNSGGSGWGT